MDKVFEVVNEHSASPLILTCEHASAKIPASYQGLGLDSFELDRHIARDKGACEVTKLIAKELGCFAILGGYSRLLIDLNRRPDEEELIVRESDKTVVSGNLHIDAAERKKRLEKYYYPYYDAILKKEEQLLSTGKTPVIFSIHSYTPQLKGGDYRPWHAGILYHKPAKLASYLYDGLLKRTDKIVGENVPYDLRRYDTGAVVVCGEEKGLDYGLIEIRDDEFDNLEQGAKEWALVLADLLKEYPAC